MSTEKNASSQQHKREMLESCPLQITTPTISGELTMPSPVNIGNTCSAPKTVGELTVLPVFPASTKGNPPSIYEKGGSNDKQSTANTVVTQDLDPKNRGTYTFRVQGRMYHWLDNLYPNGKKAKNLQLYFDNHDNELANRMVCSDKVDESIVQELMDISRINPYSFFVGSLIHIPQLHNFHIALKCDSGLDQQLYNLPTSSEIAAIWVEKDDNTGNWLKITPTSYFYVTVSVWG
uniref:Uncharacterized protein n=1 Tax=Solanum tuberosum TaxID=4113 RepID=M1DQD2_SOLTU